MYKRQVYEPLAISLFMVLVLGASFLLGESVRYREAMSAEVSVQDTNLQMTIGDRKQVHLDE